MAFQLSPGVLVTEKDLTLIVPSVSTTAGGFAGAFQWGPVDQVTTIDSEASLVNTFGTPNVSSEDPFIKKDKFSRINKKETKEATGSGSSGSFSGPIAFKDSDFVRKSFKETPKLKESDVEKVEATEATGSGSVGGYESPAMWAKSTSKKDWGPSRKTQYKGGSFVKVKKKCTKFPYCNQGDINALKLSKNESVKEAIDNIAKKLGLNKNIIMNILEHEYKKLNKRTK